MEKQNKFVTYLFFVLVAIFVASGIEPYDRSVWYVEMTSVLTVFFGLVLTYPLFKFSNMSYLIVSLWLILHAIGAHYTFERVPFDWITQIIGADRNHFDRFAHFVIGLNSFGVAELVLRKKFVSGKIMAAFVGILFIMSLANLWELIEWIYAVVDGGETGAAFLGSQGDIWDAQKDMLCDSLGAVAAAIVFLIFTPKQKDTIFVK